ncbi:hypothetical protein CEUSTIGMA_g11164.t1 [Chlamydomonas eustigma]|uniref:Vps53 N-terminal domain-containing protein n=1 Tax=Chlamydomonas eustigma TaxID=1157962 RepID=A0A250XLD8_9CHLO|nr:hypothetical protein CEUSTIGMA_g11164.t1 [Chlamydomonas eustigma]|eukprot:GAX83739.1 hypothetical protein CEUSTIGMA_g11164.t1 [Chlamydomonas eustigma]
MDPDHSQDQVEIKLKLPSEKKPDVFDQADFDATKFINTIYPDESSLTDIDRFVGVLQKQIRSIDKEIYGAVKAQGGAHVRARDDVASAHAQIEELFSKIEDIQQKAEESESMVQDICRDIKKLDYAKKHLTNAITALRRLAMLTAAVSAAVSGTCLSLLASCSQQLSQVPVYHFLLHAHSSCLRYLSITSCFMLTAAVSDLEEAAGRRDQYKKCANLLEAIQQLMEYFQQYETIPKVRSLSRRVAQLQAQLQGAVMDDFKILMGQADVKLSPDNLDRLANACLVVDALGAKVRDQLMDWLCDREVTIYTTIFSMSGETAKLDRFERRFMWFRSRLEEKKEQWAIFPDAWKVSQLLCLTFCKITKAQAKRIISDDEMEISTNIGPLINTVVATNKFEREMAVLFGGAAGGVEEEDDDEAASDADNLSAGEVRRRLEKYRKKERMEAHKRALEKMTDKERQAAREAKTTFEGSISEAFEPVLRFYITEEEKELNSHLETVLREEYENKWCSAEEEDGPRVLPSANKLFFKIRTSLTRCSRMISKGETLVGLTGIFHNLLDTYSAALLQRLPKTAAGQTSASLPLTGQDWFIRLTEAEELVVCRILKSAEFCRDTIEGLSAAIHKDVKPALADQVDFSDLEGSFLHVASQCMNVLVMGVMTRLEVGVQEMTRVRWDLIEQPGDDSTFVLTIRKVLLDCAPRLGKELEEVSFSFFCDKMARMFVPHFQEHLYRLKRISEKGTLQLSIDCDAVKRALAEFHKHALGPSAELGSYSNYIEREMGAVVNTVKVLQSKPENLVDTFMLLMPAHAQGVQEFVHVCEMKTLTRKQHSDLMALFQHKMAGGDAASAPIIAPVAATAASLGNFKNNLNSITASLTSSIPFPRAKGAPTALSGPEAQQQALLARFAGAAPASHNRTGSGAGVSFTDAATAVKERTRDGFAKMVKGLSNWSAEGGPGGGPSS